MKPEEIKKIFERDTEDHKMDVLMDDGVYRHLKFTKGGSQVYRFDIHTWPGYLCVSGDMGTYVFSRINDMFEFFIMDDNDFNKAHIINPHYWGEKLQATDGRGETGYMEFSQDLFADAVKSEYEGFAEQYEDEDEEGVTESYPEGTQSYKDMLVELWDAIEEDVIGAAYDGEVRGYDAAMQFRWESDDGKLKFDMADFWDHSCRDYTFHYIWILYAIVWGIGEYTNSKEEEKAA